jgi:hypothetical protein
LIEVDQACTEAAGDRFIARFIASKGGLLTPRTVRVAVSAARLSEIGFASFCDRFFRRRGWFGWFFGDRIG